MKPIIAIAIILSMFASTLSAQKKYTKEEQSLIDLIQLHYDHWKNREYEKWTDLWVHEPYVGHIYIGPENFMERKGWEEVDASQRDFLKNNTNTGADVDFSQFNYTFLIRGNMAVANFIGENGLYTTSVFEKIKGEWKYLRNEQVNKTRYDLKSDLRKLGSFEGTWQLIPGSFTWENSDNKGEIIRYTMHITPSLNGIGINTKFKYKNAQQNIWPGSENISVNINSPSNKLIHNMSTYFANNGWTNNSSGSAEVTDQAIELNGTQVVNEKNTYNLVLKMVSTEQMNISSTNASGEKWSLNMALTQ